MIRVSSKVRSSKGKTPRVEKTQICSPATRVVFAVVLIYAVVVNNSTAVSKLLDADTQDGLIKMKDAQDGLVKMNWEATCSHIGGVQTCDADGGLYSCANEACDLVRACPSNPRLLHCGCPYDIKPTALVCADDGGTYCCEDPACDLQRPCASNPDLAACACPLPPPPHGLVTGAINPTERAAVVVPGETALKGHTSYRSALAMNTRECSSNEYSYNCDDCHCTGNVSCADSGWEEAWNSCQCPDEPNVTAYVRPVQSSWDDTSTIQICASSGRTYYCGPDPACEGHGPVICADDPNLGIFQTAGGGSHNYQILQYNPSCACPLVTCEDTGTVYNCDFAPSNGVTWGLMNDNGCNEHIHCPCDDRLSECACPLDPNLVNKQDQLDK